MRITINPDRPVRKIPTSTRSITGLMPTADKDGQAFESTLERDLMYLLKFDVTVDKFVSQPVKITYLDKENISRSYTPDILIYHRKDFPEARKKKIILAEVKFKDDLCKNFREYHPKFRAAMRYAKEKDWVFKVYTDAHIRTPYLTNAKFLLGYVNTSLDPIIIESILNRIDELRETDPQGLLASFYTDKWNQAKLLPVIWHLIARREIGTNLHYPLTMSSRIWRMHYE